MYAQEAEARFDAGCAKEDRRVREGDPCIVYIYEELRLGCTKVMGALLSTGVTWFITMLVGRRVVDAS